MSLRPELEPSALVGRVGRRTSRRAAGIRPSFASYLDEQALAYTGGQLSDPSLAGSLMKLSRRAMPSMVDLTSVGASAEVPALRLDTTRSD